ncbi:hypothetical protein P4133_35060 [Pseudomonas aeruginosa]|nr:hypothetical protein [Pseudomonas aeruginosa]
MRPSLFGGDKGEGGLDGTLDVLFGDEDQGVLPRLAAMLGGLVPAFRGVTTWFYSGLVTSSEPVPEDVGDSASEAGTACGTAIPGIPKSSSSG